MNNHVGSIDSMSSVPGSSWPPFPNAVCFCCRMFIDTCKRLKIMKGSDAIGLGMYCHWQFIVVLFPC